MAIIITITLLLLAFLLFLLLFLYFYLIYKQSYWSRLKIPFIKPQFPFGNIRSPDGKNIHFMFLLQNYYNQLKVAGRPFGGIYFFQNPVVVTVALDFIKKVLIKDFSHFHDRGVYYNEKDDPISAHLFAIDGEKWRNLRTKLTPTFTSGKMKFMYPTIIEIGKNLQTTVLIGIQENNSIIEVKELLARFTTDVIGTCAFGIECNSLANPNAEFRRMGKKVFEKPKINVFQRIFMSSFKNVARILKMKINSQEIIDFFVNIIKETVQYREKYDIKRNDFMDTLIQLKNQKTINDNDHADTDDNINNKNATENFTISDNRPLTLNEISAQAFVFFLAGFETSSITMTFCLYELAVNRDVQTKLRNEIRTSIDKHNGELTYEAVMDMKYLDQVINETLRKYPPVGNLIRDVTKDYYVPEMKCTLLKGTSVLIPVYGIHHDSEYYPEPERFDPNRFTPEEIQKRNPMAFLPFGDGPRNCIGMRFGFMQTRIGLITLLNKFEISVSVKTQVPLALSNVNFVLAPQDGLYLNVKEI